MFNGTGKKNTCTGMYIKRDISFVLPADDL